MKEKRHFPADNTYPGETCWTLEQQWFWTEGSRAGNVGGIMKHMQTANARNSNFLLNVGPNPRGRIVDSSVAALKKIGELRQGETSEHE